MVAVIVVNDALPLRYRNLLPERVSLELRHLQAKLAAPRGGIRHGAR